LSHSFVLTFQIEKDGKPNIFSIARKNPTSLLIECLQGFVAGEIFSNQFYKPQKGPGERNEAELNDYKVTLLPQSQIITHSTFTFSLSSTFPSHKD